MTYENSYKRDRAAYQGSHILASNVSFNTDTWETGLNNNVLVFGPSGAGKTRSYVKPNILSSHESMIISDTKGSLHQELGEALRQKGFRVICIDFTDLSGKGGYGYNPLDSIRFDEEHLSYKEQDIQSLCQCIVKDKSTNDPFWDQAARQYLAMLISYELESNLDGSFLHAFEEIHRLYGQIGTPEFEALVDELDLCLPDSITGRRYEAIKTNIVADKMHSSICGILSSNLDPLVFEEAMALFQKPERIDFASLGREKTALFITISDTDRSMDALANTFMTQAIQKLCYSADHDYASHRLPVPVRLYLDDFATNLFIPEFDKIISVIRSREISVSIILQSITQLYSLYGDNAGKTIVNNCDRQLYLGGQDVDTAAYIAARMNKPLSRIMDMPLEDACLLIRGRSPFLGHKYDLQALEREMQARREQEAKSEEMGFFPDDDELPFS